MIVVKAGGNGSLNMEAVCTDVAVLLQQGQEVVLVHGSSHETNVISERLGYPPRFVTSVSGHSSRYTDRETLEILAMVAAGRINKLLVERLQQLGVNALGLSGWMGDCLRPDASPACASSRMAGARFCVANTAARSNMSTPNCCKPC